MLLGMTTRMPTIYCVRDKHVGTYRKHEYAQEGSGAQRSIYTCTQCVFCERNGRRQRVCVHVRGEAEQERQHCMKLKCQMSEGSFKSVAPSRATGCQDAHHTLFRCLSLVTAD